MSAKLLRFALAAVCIGAVSCRGLADATYNESANSTNGKMSGAENVGAINAATTTISGKTALPSDQD